jgi:hypothetical protein
MTSELDRGLGQNETVLSPEALKMERFYEAYKYLESHPIFNTTPGETVDLSDDPLGIASGFDLDLTDESLKAVPYNNYRFDLALDIDVVKVNPETGQIDDDPAKNTLPQVWLECGPWEADLYKDEDPELREETYKEIPEDKRGGFTHDTNLDCGGDTFEDAIIALAELVKLNYDNPEATQDTQAS